MKIAEELGDND